MSEAINKSYLSALDAIHETIMRKGEIEDLKSMLKWIYLGDEEVDVMRKSQIQLQEDLTKLLYVVASRVQYMEGQVAHIVKEIDEQLLSSPKKLTVEQRKAYIRTHDSVSELMDIVDQGNLVLEMIGNQMSVVKARQQHVMEKSFEYRKLDASSSY